MASPVVPPVSKPAVLSRRTPIETASAPVKIACRSSNRVCLLAFELSNIEKYVLIKAPSLARTTALVNRVYTLGKQKLNDSWTAAMPQIKHLGPNIHRFLLSALILQSSYSHADYSYQGVSYDKATATMTWDGPIDDFHYCIFQCLAEDSPVNTLILQSYGGLTDVGYELAEYVDENQVTVIVDTFCDSACVLPAIVSPNLSGKGVLGFHLAYLTKGTGIDGYDCDALHEIGHLNEELLMRYRNSKYLNDEMVDWIESESTSEYLVEFTVEELRSIYLTDD